jgi:hypothetical protein
MLGRLRWRLDALATPAVEGRSLPNDSSCLGLSVACERDDAGESLLLRVAGDGQATMEETAEALR